MSSASLRPAASADSAAIALLLAELGYPSTSTDVDRRMARFQASGDDHVIVAVDGAAVVGVMSVSMSPLLATSGGVARITSLVVAERCRGTGVGGALVGEAERIAAAAGCTRMEVSSGLRSERVGAHRFYRALGYTDAGSHHVVFDKVLRSNASP